MVKLGLLGAGCSLFWGKANTLHDCMSGINLVRPHQNGIAVRCLYDLKAMLQMIITAEVGRKSRAGTSTGALAPGSALKGTCNTAGL